MPPPSTDNWEAVKATAIALNSIKLAAEQHGVGYEAARQQASREKWPVGRRPAKAAKEAQQFAHAQLVKVSPRAVTSVTSTADALSNVLAEDSRETRISLSKAARQLAKKGETADLSEAGDVLQVGKLAALTHEWQQPGGSSLVINVALIGRSLVDEAHAESQ